MPFVNSTQLMNYDFNGTKLEIEVNEKIFTPSQDACYFANYIKIKPNEKIIDVGTGCGILAIYAAKQGAIAYATDTSLDAIKATQTNANYNRVEVNTSQGAYFANYKDKFDVIVANLPQEILPANYKLELGEKLVPTIDGGPRGNVHVLNFLNEAKNHMHEKSRIYVPVYTYTDYTATIEKIASMYAAKVIAFKKTKPKEFVFQNLEMYLKLNQDGVIHLNHEDNQLSAYIFVFELTLKQNPLSEILIDEKISSKIVQELTTVFSHLNFDSKLAKEYATTAVKITKEKGVTHAERFLHKEFEKLGVNDVIASRLSGRADKIYSQIKDYLVGNDVLDLGAGDGKVGELISKQGKHVTLVDVMDYNQTSLPFYTFNGTDLPYRDKSFDTTLLLTVLHHADEPLRALAEAKRVTSKRIIIIESIYLNEEHKKVNTFLDWFYNCVLHQDVNVPFNFNSPKGWEKVFADNSLIVEKSINLGVDQPTVPEHHWLYVLKVK